MSANAHKKDNRLLKAISAAGTMFLVVIYFAGTLQFSSIHNLVHPEAEELHSAEHERELCHQAIYHQGKETCGHKVHLSVSDKCSLCHVAAPGAQLLPENSFELAVAESHVNITDHYQFLSADFFSDHSVRGPPTC